MRWIEGVTQKYDRDAISLYVVNVTVHAIFETYKDFIYTGCLTQSTGQGLFY